MTKRPAPEKAILWDTSGVVGTSLLFKSTYKRVSILCTKNMETISKTLENTEIAKEVKMLEHSS